MASTFTPNLSVEKPGSGDYVGTWDSPVNSNMGVFDSALGTTQSIALGAGSITLSTAQTRSAHLNFSGTLPANVTVTIPTLSSAPGTTVSGRVFTVQNLVDNSSQFTVTLTSTVAGSQSIALPPDEAIDIMMEGSGSSTPGAVKFRNLGRVGTYWDYAGSSVPAWVTGCTIPPYLNCNGGTFSAATYPRLASILGSTTLPDAAGRYRATLNQGTGRIVAGSGVNGDTIFSAGGSQTVAQANLPAVTLNTTIATGQGGHTHNIDYLSGTAAGGGGTLIVATFAGGSVVTSCSATLPGLTGTTPLGGSGTAYAQPTYIGGLTLIRAA